MKKVLSIVLCVLMMASMLVAFTACGGKDDKGAAEVKAYVEKNEEQIEATSSNSLITCDLETEGTKVVYKMTYTDLDGVTSEQKGALEDAFEAQRGTLEGALDQMKTECSAVTGIVCEYYETDGDLIFKGEIK